MSNLLRLGVGRGGGAAPSSLLTGLQAYWKLDEPESSQRLDSTANGNDLNDNGVCFASGGKVGDCVDFASNPGTPQFQSIADNAYVGTPGGSSWTFAGWVWLNSLGQDATIIDKFGADTNGMAIDVTNGYSGKAGIGFYNAGVPETYVQSDTFGTIPEDEWVFIAAGYDHTTEAVFISVNGGVKDIAVVTGAGANSTADLGLGARVDGPAILLEGKMDEWGKWSRVLTDDEIDELYNGGAGTTYPF